ncbi:UvrD-helicase domain-containing protein [Erwinia sp. PK3-005]
MHKVHPYFFLINSRFQEKIVNKLSQHEQQKLLELGIELVQHDESLSKKAYGYDNVQELLSYISFICSSDDALSEQILERFIVGKVPEENSLSAVISQSQTKIRQKANRKARSKIPALAITPDNQQTEIINHCHQGIQVDAFAGAGKSTVSKLMIDELGNNKTLYTAFLRENITEAKLKITEQAYTQDALAHRYALEYAPFKSIFNNKHAPHPYSLQHIVGFDASLDLGRNKVKRHTVARLITQTVSRFCTSTDLQLAEVHLPVAILSSAARKKVLAWATTYWDYLTSGRATLEQGATYEHLMKYWSLTASITLPDDYENIIVDEAQDISGAFFNVLRNHTDRNIVIVGDTYQQLFKWRGAVNSMGLFDKPRFPLTTSYRFGEAIADCSNRVLAKHSQPPQYLVCGQQNLRSQVIFYDESQNLPNMAGAILTRTRSQIIFIADNELRAGHKIHIKTEINSLKFIINNIIYLSQGELDKITHPYILKCPNVAFLESDLIDNPEPDVYFAWKLFKKYGFYTTDLIDKIAENNYPVEQAVKVISTTHAIKGQEWDNIVIAPDYAVVLDNPNADIDSELSVLYVAITRAKHKVFIPESLKNYF